MTDYLLHHNANTHWRYPTSEETDAALAQRARVARRRCSGASPDEVAFGANMTTLTFHVARALGRGWGPGDEIIVTELDHHANVAPWQALARERGVTVRTARMIPETGELDWSDFERLVTRARSSWRSAPRRTRSARSRDVRRAGELVHAVGRAAVRRRRALRTARARRRARARLRPAGVLGLQVLRAARRRPVRAARRCSSRSTCPKLAARARHGARTARDRHAEPRRHRRRGPCGGVPGLARRPRDATRRPRRRPSRRSTPAASSSSSSCGTGWRPFPA